MFFVSSTFSASLWVYRPRRRVEVGPKSTQSKLVGIRTRERAGELEISLAVATATRRANRFIVVMDEAVMVVM